MKLYTKKFVMLVDILVLVSHQIVNIYFSQVSIFYFTFFRLLVSLNQYQPTDKCTYEYNSNYNQKSCTARGITFRFKKSKGDIRNQGKSCIGVN